MKTDSQVKAYTLLPDVREKRMAMPGHPGLTLQVRPTSKTWLFCWKADGKQHKETLGPYPEITLLRAREKAAEARRRLAEGLPPVEPKKAVQGPENGPLTLRGLFVDWREKQLVSRKDGGASVQALFDRYVLTALGDTPAADVKRRDVAALLDAAKAAGVNRTVAVLLSSMRQMYRFAISRELLEADPTATLRSKDFGVTATERDRVLSIAELRLLAPQLGLSTPDCKLPGTARLKDGTKLAVWLLLSTGVRISELMSVEWADVDLKAGTLNIVMPDSKTKSHKQTIYLSAFALARFVELHHLSTPKKHKYCWPDMRKGGAGPVCAKTIAKQIHDRQSQSKKSRRSKACQALALPGGKWTPHDLRRTAATLMGDAGVDSAVIERILNHTDENRIRRTYQRQQLIDQQKAAWALLGDILEGVKSGVDHAHDIHHLSI